jgi:CHAT domain-containing protein
LLQPATILTGARATKPAVLQHWESVRMLYYAGHVVRDPNLPFCSFLPLATEGAGVARSEHAYLGMADVRGADLSGCELVVLSACGGGAAYVTARSAAPGLGEAFLDAGARAVIRNFWDVRDEDAEQLMAMFLDRWGSGAADPIGALCDARRTAFHSDGYLASPLVWGSLAIGVSASTLSASTLQEQPAAGGSR